MEKLSINLLPADVLSKERDQSKRARLTRLSLLFIIIMVGIAALTLLGTLAQKRQLDNSNAQLQAAMSKVQSYHNQESLLVYLKQRLDNINLLQGKDSPEVQSYYLIEALVPQNVSLSSFSLSSGNQIILSASSNDTQAVKNFFDNLTNPISNQKKISKVKIESLNRSSDGTLRMDLTITTT